MRLLSNLMKNFFCPDQTESMTDAMQNCKQKKSLAARKKEVENFRAQSPTKIPVILERFPKESELPVLKYNKYLFAEDITMGMLHHFIRKFMEPKPTQELYIFINNKIMPKSSRTIAEVYSENKNEDGFLYITYASQKKFGHNSKEGISKAVEILRFKYPTRIPVILERYAKESQLPVLEKNKFLVPQEIAVSHFFQIIRSRLSIGPTHAFYLLVNEKNMVSMSKTMAEVYLENKNEDGFLYVTYASQEMFGHNSKEALKELLHV